ncbi:MAG: alpha/beta hydrolase [Acidimicrobiales bacterium]|nr:alpha/beta hydrolase [Acidimicrobiales bacterium]
MPIAEVRGARITYDDTGGEGEPVILAHGFLMDRSMFAPQVDALRATHRVITWDERGFGDTEYDGAPFTYWDSAADCLGLLDHLAIERAVVGGMSQGGFVSLRVALTAPERVLGLVLIDTQAGPEDADVLPLYQAMIDGWAAEGLSDETAEVVAGLIVGHPNLNPGWIAKWHARPAAAIAQPGTTLLTRDDVHDRLHEITVPALVVHGEDDAAVSVAKGERLAAGLGGPTELLVVPGGTHAANLSHPAEVNAAIASFLATLPT